jgi:hypothetical protein
MSRLKEQIAARKYRVDSRAVAHEMLFKMRMQALVSRSAAPDSRPWPGLITHPPASRAHRRPVSATELIEAGGLALRSVSESE